MEYLKDFCLVLSLSLQGINIGFNGQRVLSGGRHGWGLGLGGAYSLWAGIGSSWSVSSIVTFVSAVILFPAMEAGPSLMHLTRSIGVNLESEMASMSMAFGS